MDKQGKEHRDRLVALTFVSVLLVLIYGPGAPWFVAADRLLYDRLASHVANEPLENALIVSISDRKLAPNEILDQYGKLIQIFKNQSVKRIILADPPEMEASADLPGWAATLSSGVPVYVPNEHRLAQLATKSGFLDITPDSDGIFRESGLWRFGAGLMSPSLPLAVALDNPDAGTGTDPRFSGADDVIYLSNYQPIARLRRPERRDAQVWSMLSSTRVHDRRRHRSIPGAWPTAVRWVPCSHRRLPPCSYGQGVPVPAF